MENQFKEWNIQNTRSCTLEQCLGHRVAIASPCHIYLQLLLLHNLASTVGSGAGLEVGTPVLLPRPPPHLHQTGFVVGDLSIK